MSCTQTEKISLLIDGELAPAEVRETERHLLECSECQLARADFLGLRSQIGTYSPMLEPAAPKAALARILSPASVRERRNWFEETFAALRLNRPATAFAALLLVALGIAALLFVRSRFSSNEQLASHPPVESESPAAAAGDKDKRRPAKDDRTGPATSPRKSNTPGKPVRERSSPKPPEPRTLAPPNYARVTPPANASEKNVASTTPADSETLTLRHLEQSELLLRGFRNIRLARNRAQNRKGPDVDYERRRAQELIYQNMLLRREAETSGDVQVATLLGDLEPILLDIANLRNRPQSEEVRAIKDRMERKSLVALLQVSSASVARANE